MASRTFRDLGQRPQYQHPAAWSEEARTSILRPPPKRGAAGAGTSQRDVLQCWRRISSEGLPFQPWAAELVKKRMADNSKDNPDAHCLPMGFMQFHTHSQPRKIVQTADVILIIYEANSGLRQIFHGWTAPAGQGCRTLVVRLLGRKVGRGHSGRRNNRFH